MMSEFDPTRPNPTDDPGGGPSRAPWGASLADGLSEYRADRDEAGVGGRFAVAVPTDDLSLARRRRALAPVATITDLERDKALFADVPDDYDLATLALACVDQVALTMGLSDGMTWDEAVGYVSRQAARQHPGRDGAETVTVAERVLARLVTTDVNAVGYVTHGPAGPERRATRFRMLYLRAGPDGQEHLRASEQAINCCIGMLDMDPEVAALASEATLKTLIERGALSQAVQVATQARLQTAAYLEDIRRIVADTLLDPDAHDWAGDVPVILDRALRHVSDRIRAEGQLLEAVETQRGDLIDADQVIDANHLVGLLDGCMSRHRQLARHLTVARDEHLNVLDERFSRPPSAATRVDVTTGLAAPFTAGTAHTAVAIEDALTRWFLGWSFPVDVSLSTLADELCDLGDGPSQGEEVDEPEYVDPEPEWWEDYVDPADSFVANVTGPTRLSAVLADVDDAGLVGTDGEALDIGLLGALVVHVAHTAWAADVSDRRADERVVLAVTSGDRIDTATVTCDDLILFPADVVDDIAAAASSSGQGVESA